MRDKEKCMHLSTGLCPKNEGWGKHDEPCDDCKHYIDRNGETEEVDDGPARETA